MILNTPANNFSPVVYCVAQAFSLSVPKLDPDPGREALKQKPRVRVKMMAISLVLT